MIAATVLGLIPVAIWLYGILSLAVVRMLAVGIAMIGAKLKPSSVAFLGWFGPRGLASIVLGLVFLEREANLTFESSIILAVAATVLLSLRPRHKRPAGD